MSQDSTARLERRARTLLRAYPADYRRDRAEELIGTLLEATPAGRSFPSARDARALIAGGARARAARNRRLTTTANLRLALLLGLSIFLAFNVNIFLAGQEAGYDGVRWLAIAAGLLSVAAALVPWLGSRTVATVIVLPDAQRDAQRSIDAAGRHRGMPRLDVGRHERAGRPVRRPGAVAALLAEPALRAAGRGGGVGPAALFRRGTQQYRHLPA
jgi:hypothetical protein